MVTKKTPSGTPERRSGSERRKNASKAPAKNAGTAHDAAAQGNGAKKEMEQFAYVASHDLREPLRKIAGYAELLETRYAGKLDANADRYLRYLRDGVQRMEAMLGDLLTYSRAGRADDREPVELSAVVEAVLRELSRRIADAEARVDVGELPRVRGSQAELTLAFKLLLDNAIKFKGAEPPRIRVSGRREGETCTVSIADNGIGIAPESFERIFEIFQRLHTRSEYPGTGIGLAICKKIVDKHGGRIWVESEPGRGSTFHVTLPAA
ncbi:MAG: GHKL domain-containing protein [Elusimicrobia bacterium]|nr:GHKL domain-containing protein [Elusimicrobiota bacterium]